MLAFCRTFVHVDRETGKEYNEQRYPHISKVYVMRVQRKNFAAFVEMSPEEIGKIDRIIAEVQNYLNKTRWEAITQLFFWGIEVAGGKLEKESTRQEIRRLLISRQFADILDQERVLNKRIFGAVKELGREKALEIAAREGLDIGEVKALMEKAIPADEEMAPTVQMGFWLHEVLKDGDAHPIENVQQQAIEDGILPTENDPDFDRHWNRLKAVASRSGYSSRASVGVWKKS